MELLLCGIDLALVKKLDEFTKKQGTSRTQFFASMINNFTALEEFEVTRVRHETMISLKVIQQNSNAEEKLLQHLEEL